MCCPKTSLIIGKNMQIASSPFFTYNISVPQIVFRSENKSRLVVNNYDWQNHTNNNYLSSGFSNNRNLNLK